MQDRAKLISHMMTTIDGKIDVEFEPNDDYNVVGDEYDRLQFEMGQAWGGGRVTMQSEIEDDLARFADATEPIADTAKPAPGEHICVAIDRFGKLRWESGVMEYAGHSCPLVEAVTEKCSPAFAAYLKSLGIGVIVAGKDDFDHELFLRKLKQLCGIDTFVLSGGSMTHAEFLRRGLVDEISHVVAPAVDGTREALTMAGTNDLTGFPRYYHFKIVEKLPKDGLHIVWTK